MRALRRLASFIRPLWRRLIGRWQKRITSLIPRAAREQDGGMIPWWGWGLGAARYGDADGLRYRLPLSSGSDLSVEVIGNTLVLRGSASRQWAERGRGYYCFAAVSGSIYRSLPLPPEIDPSRIEAFSRGREVEIRLPKRRMTAAAVRRIPVRAG